MPTVGESGFPGFADYTWFSFFAPAGTPPAIVKRLNAEISRIMQLPDVKERLDAQSLVFTPNTPEQGHDFRVFHGTPYDIGDADAFPARLSDEKIAEKLKDFDFDVGAHGHIHGPSVRYIKKPNKTQILVCVAAVGMSWDGDPRPAYAVVDYLGGGKWEARVERVEFDCEAQAKFNENCWIEKGERIASMIRTGKFWNPDHMPH